MNNKITLPEKLKTKQHNDKVIDEGIRFGNLDNLRF